MESKKKEERRWKIEEEEKKQIRPASSQTNKLKEIVKTHTHTSIEFCKATC